MVNKVTFLDFSQLEHDESYSELVLMCYFPNYTKTMVNKVTFLDFSQLEHDESYSELVLMCYFPNYTKPW